MLRIVENTEDNEKKGRNWNVETQDNAKKYFLTLLIG